MRAVCAAVLGIAAACSSSAPPVPPVELLDDGGTGPATDAGIVQKPPPATLTIIRNGSGSVRSNPAGIDCGDRCSASLPSNTGIKLIATPAPGFRFDGWWGFCRGSGDCSFGLAPGSDNSVYAVFAAEQSAPTPPAPECADLVPADPGEGITAVLPQPDCLYGTSDEVTGTFALGYWGFTWGPTYPVWLFFSLRDGSAVQLGDGVFGADDAASWIFSQPSGFTFVLDDQTTFRRFFSSYDDSGNKTGTRTFTPGLQEGEYGPIVSDPSGGTDAFSTHAVPDGGIETMYQRFDKYGAPEVKGVVAATGHPGLYSAAVDLEGNVLAISRPRFGAPQDARWFAREGHALTDWFTVSPDVRGGTFLVDGSVALVEAVNGVSQYTAELRAPETLPSALPSWLAQRSANLYAAVRGGRAYATWGPSGTCGLQMELIAASGAKCGCIAIPDLSLRSSVGRDGSVIVPQHEPQNEKCVYRLYPKLLR